MFFARTIREEELVVSRINAAIKKEPRLQDVYEGLKWRTAQSPYDGTKVEHNNKIWYMAKAISWGPGGKPAITILYSVTENEIYIEASKIEWLGASKKRG